MELLDHMAILDFPGGSDDKASAYNVGDQGLISGSGRYPGEENGNPLQYSCLEEPGRLYIVHGVTKSWTRLKDFTFMVILFLVSEESPYCFPWQLHNFTFLSTVHKDFNLSISLTFVILFLVFYSSHLNGCEIMPLYSPMLFF